MQSVSGVIDAIFTTHQTLDDVFMSTGYYGTADIRFGSSRTLDSDVHMDPHANSAGADPYYRAVVGRLVVTTDEVLRRPRPGARSRPLGGHGPLRHGPGHR